MKKQTKIALGVGITLLLGYGIYRFLRQPKPKSEEKQEDIVVQEGCKFPETPCFNDKKKCYNPFSFNQNDGISKCYNV